MEIEHSYYYLLINRKWRNSAKNCRAFNSFVSVSSDHRIVSAQIRLTLRANKKKSNSITCYDWSVLKNDANVAASFVTTVNNRFAILQDSIQTISANNTYKSFETACREAADAIIPQKTKVKTRKPWENEEIHQKRQLLHQAQQMKESSPSPENIRLFNEARFSLKEAYSDEQKSYLESKISQIRNSATNKRSGEAWKTVDEITGRKSSNSSKLKAASQEERIQLWKDHFKDLLGKPPQVSNELITPILQEELNIKKEDFSMDKLVKALKSTQNHKACGLDEIPAEVWKLPDFHQILLNLCNSVYNGDSIDLMINRFNDLSIAKNYRGIMLTAISAKIYNLLLLNRIRREVDPILRKNQNGFLSNRSTSGQILTIRRILEGVHAKNLPANPPIY